MARVRRGAASTGAPPRGAPPREAIARAGRQGFGIRSLGEVVGELRRVTWPTRQQVIRLTLLVLALSVGVGIFLAGVDWFFAQVTRLLL